MNEQNYLLNIDAKLGLANIPNNFIDLVLTDPPYNISADKNKLTKVGNKFVSPQKAWGEDFKDNWKNVDEYYDWLKPFIAEFVRVLKDDGTMLLFLDRKYTGLITHYIEKDFGLIFRNKIYFEKTNPIFSLRKSNYRSTIEECLFFTKSKQYCFNFGEQSEMKQIYKGSIGRSKKTKHPTEKYRWMIEPLVRIHSRENSCVLDAFSGSGTIISVAQQQGRNAIGFEMSEKLFEMAKARLISEQLQFDFEYPKNNKKLNKKANKNG